MRESILNIGRDPVSLTDVQASIARARLLIGDRSHARGRRGDSRVQVVTERSCIDELRRRSDGAAIRHMRRHGWRPDRSTLDSMRADGASIERSRADAVGSGAPGYPRDFEYRRMRILQEKRRPLNSELLFALDPEPPPLGALTHTVRRRVASGTAAIYKMGNSFPTVEVDDEEEEGEICYIVCAVGANFFQELSNNYANLDKYADKARHAIRVINEMLNRLTFGGLKSRKLYGVLSHPDLAKKVMTAAFDGSDDPVDVVAELNLLVDTPLVVSGQVFKPNRLVVSPAIHRYLHETAFDSNTGISIADWFIKGQDSNTGIRTIEMAHELAAGSDEMVAAGAPADRDGLLAYSDEPDAVRRVMVQAPTFLPVMRVDPVSTLEVAFAAFGGAAMWDIGNNVVGFARRRSY